MVERRKGEYGVEVIYRSSVSILTNSLRKILEGYPQNHILEISASGHRLLNSEKVVDDTNLGVEISMKGKISFCQEYDASHGGLNSSNLISLLDQYKIPDVPIKMLKIKIKDKKLIDVVSRIMYKEGKLPPNTIFYATFEENKCKEPRIRKEVMIRNEKLIRLYKFKVVTLDLTKLEDSYQLTTLPRRKRREIDVYRDPIAVNIHGYHIDPEYRVMRTYKRGKEDRWVLVGYKT